MRQILLARLFELNDGGGGGGKHHDVYTRLSAINQIG